MFRFLYAVLYSLAFLAITGIPSTLQAVSCNDRIPSDPRYRYADALVFFTEFNGKTYALARSAATGRTSLPDGFFALSADITPEYKMTGTDIASLKKMLALGKYGAAKPVSIDSVETQNFILKRFGKYLGAATSAQSSYLDAWKEFGTSVGFTSLGGTPLPFMNFPSASGGIYGGQNPQAVVMGADGAWVSGQDGIRTSQIVEFPDKLDCALTLVDPDSVTPPTDPADPPPVPGTLSDRVCGQDLNGNGYVDETGEVANCAQTSQGEFCPVGSANCVESFSSPVCPDTSILNTERDMCQAEPLTTVCPLGYSWEASLDRCVVKPPCPDGGLYNTKRDRCEKLVQNECPVGYSYDSARDVCRKTVDCGTGATLNPDKDRCERLPDWKCPAGFLYNPASALCEAKPYCPGGTIYNSSRDRCETGVGSCPTGYSYNPVLDTCTADVVCSSGGSLNAASDMCELASSVSCPSGWNYNSGSGKCEQSPSCTNPGSYSKPYDLCLATVTGTTCPSGYTWNAGYNSCIATPSCVGGSYSTANDRCEAPLNYSCPDPAYTYKSARNRCEKTPACAYGSYNPVYDKCLLAANVSCPSGYTYKPASNRCEKTPECPASTSYSVVTNRCEGLPSCTSGNYNAAADACVSSGSYAATITYTCPSGGSLSGTSCTIYGYYAAIMNGGAEFRIPVYKKLNRVTPICELWITDSATTDPTYADLAGYVSANSFAGAVPVSLIDGSYFPGQSHSADPCFEGVNYCLPSRPAGTYPLNISGYQYQGLLSSSFGNSGQMCVGGCANGWASLTSTTRASASDCFLAPVAGLYGGEYTCPAGGTLSGSQCATTTVYGASSQYSCPSGGTLSGSNCTTTSTVAAICPAGTWLDGIIDRCINANPTCSGGSFDGNADVCWTTIIKSCPGSSVYDPAVGQCVSTPLCSNGLLDTLNDVCFQSAASGCPGGYALTGSICTTAAYCTPPGILNGSIDYCSAAASFSCPTGYSYNSTLNICYSTAQCSAGNLNTALDVCQQSFSLVCPAGYSLNGSSCQKAALCPAGGGYSATLNLCDGGSNACSTPTILDTASDVCYQPASCGAGILNSVSDNCESPAVVDCGSWSWDATSGVCYSPTVCSSGVYNSDANECQAGITRNCGSYSWNPAELTCTQGVICPTDNSSPLNGSIQFDPKLDLCISEAAHTCPTGLTWNGVPVVKCEAVPICTGDGIYNPITDSCFEGLNTCPLGSQYACMEYAGIKRCSPNPCYDASGDAQIEDMDESMLKDDARDANGNCLGQMYIFNGKPSRCRPPGLTVGMINNCCKSDKAMTEDTGNSISSMAEGIQTTYEIGQVAYYGNALATGASQISAVTTSASGAVTSMTVVSTTSGATATLSGAAAEGAYAAMASGTTGASAITAGIEAYAAALLNPATIIIAVVIMVAMKVLMGKGCDQGDIQTGMQEKSKQCHYVGDYCYKKFLFGCVQRAKGYCCFNSKMARIIHEQGRPQLTTFQPGGNWGNASSPNCRGFTPDEFQSLDFSKIDLSEYFEDIQKDLAVKINNSQETIMNSINNKYQTLKP